MRLTVATALVLLFGTSAAIAQINPFRTNREGLGMGLGQSDMKILGETAEHLNEAPEVHVGDRQDWSNPDTGNSGHVTVARVFDSGGRACHTLRYDLMFKAKRPGRTYTTNWCRTETGEWKIKS